MEIFYTIIIIIISLKWKMGLNDNATTHIANKEIVNPTTTAPDHPKHRLIQSPIEHQLGQKPPVTRQNDFYGERQLKCRGQQHS